MCNGYDLTGKKFGRLLVLEEIQERKFGEKQYRCRCDCGNTCVARTSSLRTGNTKSCGCLRKRKEFFDNIRQRNVGKRMGSLTVTKIVDGGYECICDCGRVVIVPQIDKRRKSCGCSNGHQTDRKRIFYEATGVMPKKNETVIFLDGNTNNIRAENMMSISKSAYLQMFNGNLFSTEANLTKSAAMACELIHKANIVKNKN